MPKHNQFLNQWVNKDSLIMGETRAQREINETSDINIACPSTAPHLGVRGSMCKTVGQVGTDDALALGTRSCSRLPHLQMTSPPPTVPQPHHPSTNQTSSMVQRTVCIFMSTAPILSTLTHSGSFRLDFQSNTGSERTLRENQEESNSP